MTDAPVRLPAWRPPPARLDLPDDTVHVWQVKLDLQEGASGPLWSLLSADEQERARRFHFARDRNQFAIARIALRLFLGCYLNRPPGPIRFGYTQFGKPYLLDKPGGADPAISFNIAHSHERALLAFARGPRIGVDIEHIRPELAGGQIAERFFSAREVAALRSFPPAEQPAAFFRCWTRKEAFVKARGEGLSLPLDRFDVSLAPAERAALLGTSDDPGEVERWTLCGLESLPSGYAAALAVEAHPAVIATWQLDDLQWFSDLNQVK